MGTQGEPTSVQSFNDNNADYLVNAGALKIASETFGYDMERAQADGKLTPEEFKSAIDRFGQSIGNEELRQSLLGFTKGLPALDLKNTEELAVITNNLFDTMKRKIVDREDQKVSDIIAFHTKLANSSLSLEMDEKGMQATFAGLLGIAGQLANAFGRPDIGNQLLSAADNIRPEIDYARHEDFIKKIAGVDANIFVDFDPSSATANFRASVADHKDAAREDAEFYSNPSLPPPNVPALGQPAL